MDIGIDTFADLAAGGWPPPGRREFEAACGPSGHLLTGEPDRIIELHRIFKNDLTLVQMAIGAMPRKDLRRAIDLFGTKVAPKVKEACP